MKKQTLREFGLILLNPAAFFAALFLWALAFLLLSIKLSLLALGIMIPVGIGLVMLLVNLATHTIHSRKRWLQSLPIQLALILIVAIVQFNPFDTPLTSIDAVTGILCYALFYAVITFVIQSITLIRDWIQTRRESKR